MGSCSLYTTVFRYISDHVSSADMTIMGCIKDDQEGEYGDMVVHFVGWCKRNYLQFNITKTKEMVADFRRSGAPLSCVPIQGMDFEMVVTYKCQGNPLGQVTGVGWNTMSV